MTDVYHKRLWEFKIGQKYQSSVPVTQPIQSSHLAQWRSQLSNYPMSSLVCNKNRGPPQSKAETNDKPKSRKTLGSSINF